MPDGASEGDHRESAVRQIALLQGNRAAREPEPGPACPEMLAYLWRWFLDLIDGCGQNGLGPRQVTWGDLQAWAAMTGNRPEPWEVAALMRLGATFVSVRSKKESGK